MINVKELQETLMKKILLIFTGGTVCSSADGEGGKNQSNAKKTGSYLENDFKVSDSLFRDTVSFESRYLEQDILSENMTVHSWNALLRILKDASARDDLDGVIIMHGTDTLAYTSSLLSFALVGFKVPICMVSAQLPLTDPHTNGYANFRASVELIANGIAPNVYVVYRNMDGVLWVHYGNHLLQCANYSNDFYSRDAMTVSDESNARLEGRAYETNGAYLENIASIEDRVLLITPHTDLSYGTLRLRGVRAVVHGTYHSQSVCIGRAKAPEDTKNRSLSLGEVMRADRKYSILYLLSRCKRRGIPVFLAPCDGQSFNYGTTKNALDKGAYDTAGMTLEAAYAKAVVGCSLGKKGKELCLFLNSSVNHECTE